MNDNNPITEPEEVLVESPTEPQNETIVITMPAKVKRVVMAIWDFVCSLVTGEVIIKDSVSKGYNYLFRIAFAFMFSIGALFYSLHMQITENGLRNQVKLLGEKAVRTHEQRVRVTTHSAILNTLESRNIDLSDPMEQITIIKE